MAELRPGSFDIVGHWAALSFTILMPLLSVNSKINEWINQMNPDRASDYV